MALSLSFFQGVLGGKSKPRSGKPSVRDWTAGEVRQLKTLATTGTPVRTMSLKLGRSESAIRAKLESEQLLTPDTSSPGRSLGGVA
ncbi:MAG: hypothetical protein ABI743_06350 [bacterium]